MDVVDDELALDLEALAPERIRKLTGKEFDRMVEIGLFEDEHVELLDGVLVAMMGQNEPHARVSGWLAQYLSHQLDFQRFDVRGHTTFRAGRYSRPEPDISVTLRRPSLVGAGQKEALLLIEVADSSLRKDRQIKLPIYAGITAREYWIVDLKASVVEVYTHPTKRKYGHASVLRAGDTLRPLHVPGISISVAEIPFSLAGDD